MCVCVLTAADLDADPLCEGRVLRELLSETLTHVIIHVVGTQQLLEGFGGVAQVLGENVADASTLSHSLAQVRELASLSLDQCVVLTETKSAHTQFNTQLK